METNTMKVGYRLVRNATSTAEKAPYFGVAVPVGSLAYGNILQRMLDRGTFMTFATAKYFLNEFYEYAAKLIADDIVRINMGAVSIYPMIGGPFDSEDDTYREPRNRLYVGATLSQELRNAVAGLAPESLDGIAVGTVQITSVMDLASETYHLIDGLKAFRIVGIDLTVPDGEGESLALVAADGLTKVADITVVSTEDGQRIICTLATAVPSGTYYVRLVSHGLDPTAPLVTALHKVTVKAAAISPATVTLRTAVTEGMMDNNIRLGSEPITLEGENLTLGEGDALYAKNADNGDDDYVEIPSRFVSRNTATAIDLSEDSGDSLWAWIGEEVEFSEEHGRITFKLVSHGGVPSSEPQTVTTTAVVQFA